MEKFKQKSSRQNRTICLPIPEGSYNEIISDGSQFRTVIDSLIERHLELFPVTILTGYRMKEIKVCQKLSLPIRRITIQGVSFTIRPAFVMPYMTGFTSELENPLFLRKFDVPFWALSHVFGKYAMYWYRLEQSLGRNSLVGTTIKDSNKLPKHLSADEKHSSMLGEKIYIATTVGEQCILGVAVAEEASEAALLPAYQTFQQEALQLQQDYSPETVNTDGWKATQNTWKRLFPLATLIQCFLHVFIKIRDRSSKQYQALFGQIATKLWEAYQAPNRRTFSQRIRRLDEWNRQHDVPWRFRHPIEKLRDRLAAFAQAYRFPQAHRTSNMLDRLMQRMDRHLHSTQYFHGNLSSAELGIRAWALLYNFAPSNPHTVRKYQGLQSPAERLNGFKYHQSWLQNLLISASLGGYHTPPLNSG